MFPLFYKSNGTRSIKFFIGTHSNFCTKCCRTSLLFFPTEVSHLDVVVGLCSDDPKDFYNLEDRSVLRADQIRENIYYTLPVLLCWFRLYS